jgi:hypothetical protein
MEGEGFPSRKQSPVFKGSRRRIPAAPEAERRPARRCGRSRTGFRAPARARGLQAGGAPARNSFMPRQGRQHPGKPVRATPSGRLLDPTGLPSVGGALAPNRRPEGNRAHLRRKGLQAQTPSPRSCGFAAEAAPTGGLFFVGGGFSPERASQMATAIVSEGGSFARDPRLLRSRRVAAEAAPTKMGFGGIEMASRDGVTARAGGLPGRPAGR